MESNVFSQECSKSGQVIGIDLSEVIAYRFNMKDEKHIVVLYTSNQEFKIDFKNQEEKDKFLVKLYQVIK